MEFKLAHCNINITDPEKSLAFYKEALGLDVVHKKEAEDGSFVLYYLGDGCTPFELELTWLKEHLQAYDLGENESHIAFYADDFNAAHKHHEEMGCICFENTEMGIYFINDPDNYWLEVIPA